MKDDGELGVSDHKESIFSTLKSQNSCPNPVGHEIKKEVLKNKDGLHFLGHNLSAFMRAICVNTSVSTG